MKARVQETYLRVVTWGLQDYKKMMTKNKQPNTSYQEREKEPFHFYRTCAPYKEVLRQRELAGYQKYVDFLKPMVGKAILDVGCGAGQVVDYLSRQGYSAFGIDIAPHWKDSQPFGNFIASSCYHLPFEDGYFSSVGCMDVLEHLYHPEQCLGEMARVLKPGGKIVIAAPHYRVSAVTSKNGQPGLEIKRENSRGPKNFRLMLLNYIRCLFQPEAVHFDLTTPDLDYTGERIGGDYDAVCLTNPAVIKYFLKRHGIRVIYQSPSLNYPQSATVKLGAKLMEYIPFIRDIFGAVFLVGVKRIR